MTPRHSARNSPARDWRLHEEREQSRRDQHPQSARDPKQQAEPHQRAGTAPPGMDRIREPRLLATGGEPAQFIQPRSQDRPDQDEPRQGAAQQIPVAQGDGENRQPARGDQEAVQHAGPRGLLEIAPAELEPPERAEDRHASHWQDGGNVRG